MSLTTPFTWLDSNGWLVLSGPPDALGEVRSQALSRYDGASAIAYISLAPDLGDALMDDMAELGAPTGYLVDLEAADNNEIYDRLNAAGMIVIDAAQNPRRLQRLMTQTVRSALKSVLERGALVLFEGPAASLAGERFLTKQGELRAGLSFVHNALITASADGFAAGKLTRSLQHELTEVSILCLAPGSALALGPERQIETWGDGEVAISLAEPVGATHWVAR